MAALDAVELRRGDYRDPLEVMVRLESFTCAGCVFAVVSFNTLHCDKGRSYGKRCVNYREVENGAG